MSYLLESPLEGQRLTAQARANPAGERLRRAGLAPGMRVLDVGCGSGEVTRELADLVGPAGRVLAIDPSESRCAEARAALEGLPQVEVREGALPRTGLPDSAFDAVFSQYVFEYLGDPGPGLEECVRLCRPGGLLVVADIDAHGLNNWPMSPTVVAGVARLEAALARAGFDLYVGRKLFHHFRLAGLREVQVQVTPIDVIAGRADARLVADWRQRFMVLTPVALTLFGTPGAWQSFVDAYLALLADPLALKYTLLLTTSGIRP
jgi:ubiquinone/menaquinone biosynthesis C-methylase UbiE